MKLAQITWMSVLALVTTMSVPVWAETATTQPVDAASAAVSANQLELRANQDMARGDYASALPELQRASQLLSDNSDALAPVLEQIRVCRRQMKAGGSLANPASANVVGVKSVSAIAFVASYDGTPRTPHPLLASSDKLTLPIKELGNFEYDQEKGGNIPLDVMKLDGCHFQTSGYMVPLDQAEAITEFALVPSLVSCCLGQPPQVQHTIVVQCPKGKAVGYFPDAITVEGTLHVSEQRDGGFIVSIFQMDASSVRTTDK